MSLITQLQLEIILLAATDAVIQPISQRQYVCC